MAPACPPSGLSLPAGRGGVGVLSPARPAPYSACVALSSHGGWSVAARSGLEAPRAFFSLRWGRCGASEAEHGLEGTGDPLPCSQPTDAAAAPAVRPGGSSSGQRSLGAAAGQVWAGTGGWCRWPRPVSLKSAGAILHPRLWLPGHAGPLPLLLFRSVLSGSHTHTWGEDIGVRFSMLGLQKEEGGSHPGHCLG